MSTLTRFDRMENSYPELFRLWARPMQLLSEKAGSAARTLEIQ